MIVTHPSEINDGATQEKICVLVGHPPYGSILRYEVHHLFCPTAGNCDRVTGWHRLKGATNYLRWTLEVELVAEGLLVQLVK